MHRILFSAVFIAASPALADVIETKAPVREATLYPQGLSMVRSVDLDLPAGTHEIVIPGLPRHTNASSLRVLGEGVSIGAFSLQTDRALPDEAADSDATLAARREIERLERVLNERDGAVEAIRAEVQASADMVAFLRNLAVSDSAASGDVGVLADTVGARILAARRAGIDAEIRARAAEQGRAQDKQALDNARARLDALEQPQGSDLLALVIQVASDGGPAHLNILSNADEGGWWPVYDLRLDQQAKALTLERGLMVSQSTGEDWSDVKLTLSTARPSGQSAPSQLHPRIVRAYDPQDHAALQDNAAPVVEMAMEEMADDAVLAKVRQASPSAHMDYQGTTVVYHYDAPVDLRSDADAMRLPFDSQSLPVDALVAEAVPISDSSAYLVADARNGLSEVILPGRATLYADGAMTGQMDLPLTASGDDLKLSFGPIDGIVLERRVPEREEGERGMIRRSNALEETAILSARNLTGRDYDLRLIDQVPVSEQEEVKIDWSVSRAPGETDPDGKRGLLVWEMPLAAGETQEVTLETSISWPEGKQLIR
ncbi:MAG: DUF4139 domain-containing protein [Paracoccus sp. (in: a-proteobacteria)]